MQAALNIVLITLITLVSIRPVIPSVTTPDTALYLTPYIKQNQTAEARNRSVVDPKLFLGQKSWSGYLTVNETFNSNLFFWFFPSSNNKSLEETPCILWLQGGPGASSIYGLMTEFGPFYWDNQTKQLQRRKVNWNDDFSLLLIDNPLGAGFSFTNNVLGIPTNINQTTKHLLNALEQLLHVFPELRKAPLYVSGESFGGQYASALGHEIIQSKTDVNLQGLMMGNPVIDHTAISNYTAVFYQWGLIDEQGVLAAQNLQNQYIEALKSNDQLTASKLRRTLLDKLDDISGLKTPYNVLVEESPSTEFEKFFTKEIKDALHVGNIDFTLINRTAVAKTDFLISSQHCIEMLLDKKYKVLIYCGQLDTVASCTQNSLYRRMRWHWQGRHEFFAGPRVPWNLSAGPNSGYIKSGGGLTEVLVLGAGHIVPYDKPLEAKELITAFIKNLKLNTPTDYNPKPDTTPDYEKYLNSLTTPTQSTHIENQTNAKAGMIVSIIVNLILTITILSMILYFLRWKKRREGFFYTADDTSSISDGILTMN